MSASKRNSEKDLKKDGESMDDPVPPTAGDPRSSEKNSSAFSAFTWDNVDISVPIKTEEQIAEEQRVILNLERLRKLHDSPDNIQIASRNLLQYSSQSQNTAAAKNPFSNITLLTQVWSDGFGDLVHTCLTAKLLKKVWPNLSLSVKAFIEPNRTENAMKIVGNILDGTTIDCKTYDREVDQALGLLKDDLKKADALIEISCRVSTSLEEQLAKIGVVGKYHAIWGEVSLSFNRDNSIFTLIDTEMDVSNKRLRMGLELGIRFEDEITNLKRKVDTQTFSQSVKMLQDQKLSDELQKTTFNNHEYKPNLYMGYTRTQGALTQFCKILGGLHQGQNDVVNIFIRETPTSEQLAQLKQFSAISICGEKETTWAKESLEPGPVLRLFPRVISYGDSNKIVAMSKMVASGGDCSYFQALSTSALPFMERMKHDDNFFPYLRFLINEQLPKSTLKRYFSLLNNLSMPNTMEKEEELISQVQTILRSSRPALENEYAQFLLYLREHHNMEVILRGFGQWYNLNSRIDKPLLTLSEVDMPVLSLTEPLPFELIATPGVPVAPPLFEPAAEINPAMVATMGFLSPKKKDTSEAPPVEDNPEKKSTPPT